MSDKQMTAVEWLGNEITNRITRINPHDTIIIQTQGEILIEIIERSKEMEKRQIMDAFNDGINDETIGGNTTPEQYYNETYKND